MSSFSFAAVSLLNWCPLPFYKQLICCCCRAPAFSSGRSQKLDIQPLGIMAIDTPWSHSSGNQWWSWICWQVSRWFFNRSSGNLQSNAKDFDSSLFNSCNNSALLALPDSHHCKFHHWNVQWLKKSEYQFFFMQEGGEGLWATLCCGVQNKFPNSEVFNS